MATQNLTMQNFIEMANLLLDNELSFSTLQEAKASAIKIHRLIVSISEYTELKFLNDEELEQKFLNPLTGIVSDLLRVEAFGFEILEIREFYGNLSFHCLEVEYLVLQGLKDAIQILTY